MQNPRLVRVLSTGTSPLRADLKAVVNAIATKAAAGVVARCIKVARDVAYRRGRARGAVSAAAQWALVGPTRDEVWCGLDVVGGPIAQETPNVINIQASLPVVGTMSARFGDAGAGVLVKDAYAYVGDGTTPRIAHYDPVRKQPVFSEPKCGVCGTPWPASHRFCEPDTGRDRPRRRWLPKPQPKTPT
jgi:hypothetical protein